MQTLCLLSVCVADASMYAHYLFNAFDTANNGSIKFKVNTRTQQSSTFEKVFRVILGVPVFTL